MIELLAPAGNTQKLKAAFHFGADAAYLGGKDFGLRAFGGNFDLDELKAAVEYAHSIGKKIYVAANIFAYDEDFSKLKDYFLYLDKINVDAVIVSDAGVLSLLKSVAKNLEVHISTQSNITNKYAAKFFADNGAKRIVLARELNLSQVRSIRDYLPNEVVIEAFVHGAMCISYSGRCLLSNFFTGRKSNRGECTQSCRWEYYLQEKTREGQYYKIEEDSRGSYILNSKDLNMIEHIDKLVDAGVESFKIEGRIKSEYYVGNTVNAYRRAIEIYKKDPKHYCVTEELKNELNKSSHRDYTTGFYFNDKNTENYETAQSRADCKFVASVIETNNGYIKIEQRNAFKTGDTLEILSPDKNFNKQIKITEIKDENGNQIEIANKVQQILFIKTDLKLQSGDMLREA